MFEVTEHPEAPSHEELGEYFLEPVPQSEIRERRENGAELAETNLLERDDLDVYIELDDPTARGPPTNIGTVLYRFTQLFGTPQFPEYQAGDDISWRTDETFKYLFRAGRLSEPAPDDGREIDDEDIEIESDSLRLVTVYDSAVSLGVGYAQWHDGGADPTFDVDPELAVPLMALVRLTALQPVECEFDGRLF